MPVDLYYLNGSPPCAAVLLVAKTLGVELNMKHIDLSKGEHLTPEFIKINPLHSVPTLVDNGFAVLESRTIMTYLSDKYGKNDSLYPKDIKKRAMVDQRLYFDIGILYARFADYYYPAIMNGVSYEQDKLTKIEESYKFLDAFLDSSDYVAGNTLTLADISIATGVSFNKLMDFDISPYKNVTKWHAKVKAAIPEYEDIVGKNMKAFKLWVDNATKK